MTPALFGGFTSALLLLALCTGDVAANPAHHPEGGAPGGPGMAPGAPMSPSDAAPGVSGMTPPSPMGTQPAPPGVSKSAPDAPMGAPAPPPGMAGGMGEMMMTPPAGGCMGDNCGAGAGKTPIYPSLMTLPGLTAEKRAEIEALASQQVNEGMARLAKGNESLHHAIQAGDNAAMQQSVGMMREGLDQLGAGIAARRVLSEGKAPRNLALDWFKREMNLASPIAREAPRTFPGIAPFHLFTMALLIAFALAMVAMYFFKMRRTAALFGRIEPNAGSPPPGTSPPLAGAPPPAGQPPSAGGSPPPSAAPSAPHSPATPANPSPTTPPGSASSAAGSPATPDPEARLAALPTAHWRGQLRVGSIITETPSVKTFRLLPSSGASGIPFTFVPGQFLNLAFPIGGARMNRSYSISSSPTQREYVELTVRREPRGAVSRHFDDLVKVGDTIEAGGPVGRFTFTGAEADSVVLIAGGVGITPMMSIARYLSARSWPGDIYFFYACRTPVDFIFANDIAALERINPKLHVTVTMEHPEGTGWKGLRGRITGELLTQTVPDLASRRIHLCGPPRMMAAVKALLTELKVPAEQVRTEDFGTAMPTPATAGTSAKFTAPATGPLVTFSKHNKSARIRDGQTLLELSEELAISIPFSCRVGTCGICKVKMTSGEVDMAVEDGLDPDDKANGLILACQAKPRTAVVVEA